MRPIENTRKNRETRAHELRKHVKRSLAEFLRGHESITSMNKLLMP